KIAIANIIGHSVDAPMTIHHSAAWAFSGINKEIAMIQAHQPGQGIFRSILPEDIDWQPFPAFPPAVRLAVLVGHPSEPGPYVIRVKAPGGTKLMPHKHPEDRIYTVMAGVFYIGLGETF